ncbi:hypothetical protein [Rhodococcoides fascians]|uniref:hypothetical protein n=1 Tax=Rhodococcoides fascians TaxID=1828 RepID=UPI000AB8250B|nr:hypothetical protein [Rhodococcus fascians]
MARSKTSPAAIERAQRQEQALQLRLAGATIRAIAGQMKISKSTAQRYVAEAIEEIKREPAQQVVDMELQRLDAMLLGIWKDARSGDLKAIGAALKIMERRAKYQNLDQAVAPDTDAEARDALDGLHNAILKAAEQLAEPDAE